MSMRRIYRPIRLTSGFYRSVRVSALGARPPAAARSGLERGPPAASRPPRCSGGGGCAASPPARLRIHPSRDLAHSSPDLASADNWDEGREAAITGYFRKTSDHGIHNSPKTTATISTTKMTAPTQPMEPKFGDIHPRIGLR